MTGEQLDSESEDSLVKRKTSVERTSPLEVHFGRSLEWLMGASRTSEPATTSSLQAVST